MTTFKTKYNRITSLLLLAGYLSIFLVSTFHFHKINISYTAMFEKAPPERSNAFDTQSVCIPLAVQQIISNNDLFDCTVIAAPLHFSTFFYDSHTSAVTLRTDLELNSLRAPPAV